MMVLFLRRWQEPRLAARQTIAGVVEIGLEPVRKVALTLRIIPQPNHETIEAEINQSEAGYRSRTSERTPKQARDTWFVKVDSRIC